MSPTKLSVSALVYTSCWTFQTDGLEAKILFDKGGCANLFVELSVHKKRQNILLSLPAQAPPAMAIELVKLTVALLQPRSTDHPSNPSSQHLTKTGTNKLPKDAQSNCQV